LQVSNPLTSSLKEDFELLCSAVRQAGDLSMRYFGQSPQHWEKEENQPVSEADIAVNDLLHQQLQTPRPDYGWLSEETPDEQHRLTCSRVWVVDPIDGTKAFIQGKPEFTISVALVENRRPIGAVVYNPAHKEFYAAMLDMGTHCNGKPVQITERETLENSRICGYEKMFAHEGWAHLWPQLTVENRNSVAYRLALVAGGQFDATLIMNAKNDWDIAAGDLLVHEAGGVVCGLDRKQLTYNNQTTRHRGLMAGSEKLTAEFASRVETIKHNL
jgi:myo-inositol-1(or 4)-monophosphatase